MEDRGWDQLRAAWKANQYPEETPPPAETTGGPGLDEAERLRLLAQVELGETDDGGGGMTPESTRLLREIRDMLRELRRTPRRQSLLRLVE